MIRRGLLSGRQPAAGDANAAKGDGSGLSNSQTPHNRDAAATRSPISCRSPTATLTTATLCGVRLQEACSPARPLLHDTPCCVSSCAAWSPRPPSQSPAHVRTRQRATRARSPASPQERAVRRTGRIDAPEAARHRAPLAKLCRVPRAGSMCAVTSVQLTAGMRTWPKAPRTWFFSTPLGTGGFVTFLTQSLLLP